MKKANPERKRIRVEKKPIKTAVPRAKGLRNGQVLGRHRATTTATNVEMTMARSKLYDQALVEMRKSHPNVEVAERLLRRALKRQDPRAAYALATWYLHGAYNLPKDIRKGVALLRKAASAHVASAHYDLGASYENGMGVRQSYKKAYEEYLKAALWGDRQAVFEVGRCLYYAIGVPQNRRDAKAWLDRAEASTRYPRE